MKKHKIAISILAINASIINAYAYADDQSDKINILDASENGKNDTTNVINSLKDLSGIDKNISSDVLKSDKKLINYLENKIAEKKNTFTQEESIIPESSTDDENDLATWKTAKLPLLTLSEYEKNKQIPIKIENLNSSLTTKNEIDSTVNTRSIRIGGDSAPISPASISELARALNKNVDYIYEYVSNNIEYTPGYEFNRGALGTLLDNQGNAIEQSALMIALLRESGYVAEFVEGNITLTAQQMQNWYGFKAANTCALREFFAAARIPVAKINDSESTSTEQCDTNIPVLNATVGHTWVSVKIDGNKYVFDPSFKNYERKESINLNGVFNYNSNTFLNNAKSGATITSNSVQNLNRNNIRNSLTAFSNNFISYLRVNKPAANLDDILGGKKITEVANVLRNLNFENSTPKRKELVRSDNISEAVSSVLNVQYQGINQSFTSAFVYGKRLSITYNSKNQPELRLDGVIYGSPGTAITAGSSSDLKIQVIHNNNTMMNQSFISSIKAGGSYVISNGWGYTGRGLTNNFRLQLEKAKALGRSDTSEEIKGINLAFVGAQWLTQASALTYLVGKVNKGIITPHHNVGIIGYTPDGKNYVDLPAYYSTTANEASTLNQRILENNRNVAQLMKTLSVLESAVIQQVTRSPAASTISVLDDVISSGGKLLKATSSNYTNSIKSNLNNCTSDNLNEYSSMLSKGFTLFLPQSCKLNKSQWNGNAYWGFKLTKNLNEWTAKIGGYSGGYSSVILQPDYFTTNNLDLVSSIDILKQSEESYNDPIDLVKGSFLLEHKDIDIGTGSYPEKLDFNRLYTSDNRSIDTGLGRGWTHNFDKGVRLHTDGFQSLGEDSALDASGVLAALYVLSDLEKDETSPVEKEAMKIVVANWLGEQLVNNAAIVQDGMNGKVYVKLTDGTYNPPPGDSSKLIKNTDDTYTLDTVNHAKYAFKSPTTTTSGKINTYTEPSGLQVKFNYNSSGQLTSVTNSLGRVLNLNYVNNKLSSVSDGSRSVNYTYDSSGNLITFANTVGKQTKYQYDLPGRMTKIFYPTYPNNAAVTNVYDSLDRIKEQTNALGKTYLYGFAGSRSFEISPEITKIDGTKEKQSHINYINSNGQITKEIDPLSRIRRRVYDGQSRVIKQIEPEGNSVEYTYDDTSCNSAEKRCTHNIKTIKENPKSGSGLTATTTSFTYDPTTNKVASVTDVHGSITNYTYNANGTINKISLPADNSNIRPEQTYSYVSYTPTGYPTFSLPSSVLSKINSMTSTITNTTYNAANKYVPSTVIVDSGTGKLNITNSFTYDAIGNLTKIDGPRTDVNDSITTIYNTERLVSQSADGLGKITKNYYDFDGRLILSASQLGSQWMVSCNNYSYSGKVIRTGGPFLQNNDTSCPGASNLIQMVDYEYDAVDRLTKIAEYPTDNINDARLTQLFYNLDNTVKTIKKSVGNSTEQYYAQYLYTPNGKKQWSIDALNNGTRTSYDGFDRLSEIAYSTTGVGTLTINPNDTETFKYDNSGNVIQQKTRSGALVNKTYDKLNRLTAISYPTEAASNKTFKYDLLNRKTQSQFADSSNTVDYIYDNANRLTSTSSGGKTITHQYDAASNKIKTVWPDTGFSVTRSYDALNRPATIKENGSVNLASYAYDDLSRRTTVTLGNGTTTTSTYNAQNQLATLSHKLASTAQDVQFTYNRNRIGDINSETWSNDLYQYPSPSAATKNYTKNGLNQYLIVAGNAVTYDTNGNLKTDGTGWTYAYDLNNLLKSATKTTGGIVTANLNYDAEGRLRQTNFNGTVTDLLYDENDLIAEYNGTTLARRYVHGPGVDEPLVWYEGAGTTNKNWIYTNQLGSVIALANTTGANTAAYSYGPFGEPNTTTGNMRFRYTGQTLLAPLGLYYYKARMYSPTLGRFLQTDPIGQADDMNLYAYVKNNAINSVDSTGLFEAKMLMRLYYPKESFSYERLMAGNGKIFSLVQNSIPNGLNNISVVSGGRALYENYYNMKVDNTVGNDKFFHCKAHCEASTQGILGYATSQIVGAGREVTDFARPDKWYTEWKGSFNSTYNFKLEDTKADLDANKRGRDAGVSGNYCLTACSPYIVPGINKRYLK